MTSEDNTKPDEGDVEGHRIKPGLTDDNDDVEGHRIKPGLTDDEDDVEGHAKGFKG